MSTPAQIAANQRNSQHATGPKSDAGKARSSRNATRHGLTSRDLSIPDDLRPEFEALREDLRRDLYPGPGAEMVLFNEILAASWRLFRCDRAEAQLDTLVSRPGLEPLLDPALASTIHTIEKVRAQAGKALHKALAELRKVQTEHQYRQCLMPADAGFNTRFAGLADWPFLRQRLRLEGPPPEDLQPEPGLDECDAPEFAASPAAAPTAAPAVASLRTFDDLPSDAASPKTDFAKTNPIPPTNGSGPKGRTN